MRIEQFVIEGLGHLSTLLADDEAGVAVVVDPRRDVDVYLTAARERDLRITVFRKRLSGVNVNEGHVVRTVRAKSGAHQRYAGSVVAPGRLGLLPCHFR